MKTASDDPVVAWVHRRRNHVIGWKFYLYDGGAVIAPKGHSEICRACYCWNALLAPANTVVSYLLVKRLSQKRHHTTVEKKCKLRGSNPPP